MMVLVTYDVSTSDEGGATRLRHVAKKCEDFGQRVQKSVFECVVDSTQYLQLKKELTELIDLELDSIRFYRLGNQYHCKIDEIGVVTSFDIEGPLIM